MTAACRVHSPCQWVTAISPFAGWTDAAANAPGDQKHAITILHCEYIYCHFFPLFIRMAHCVFGGDVIQIENGVGEEREHNEQKVFLPEDRKRQNTQTNVQCTWALNWSFEHCRLDLSKPMGIWNIVHLHKPISLLTPCSVWWPEALAEADNNAQLFIIAQVY